MVLQAGLVHQLGAFSVQVAGFRTTIDLGSILVCSRAVLSRSREQKIELRSNLFVVNKKGGMDSSTISGAKPSQGHMGLGFWRRPGDRVAAACTQTLRWFWMGFIPDLLWMSAGVPPARSSSVLGKDQGFGIDVELGFVLQSPWGRGSRLPWVIPWGYTSPRFPNQNRICSSGFQSVIPRYGLGHDLWCCLWYDLVKDWDSERQPFIRNDQGGLKAVFSQDPKRTASRSRSPLFRGQDLQIQSMVSSIGGGDKGIINAMITRPKPNEDALLSLSDQGLGLELAATNPAGSNLLGGNTHMEAALSQGNQKLGPRREEESSSQSRGPEACTVGEIETDEEDVIEEYRG
nr:uncharacterized protein LOC9268478 isoform X1 [Oryza sativa Japonica Group]